MNGKAGVGLLQLWSLYNGLHKGKTIVPLQLKQFSNAVQKNDYVIYFNDGKCQNENIVGGKGYSLAMLTSVKDAEVGRVINFTVSLFHSRDVVIYNFCSLLYQEDFALLFSLSNCNYVHTKNCKK